MIYRKLVLILLVLFAMTNTPAQGQWQLTGPDIMKIDVGADGAITACEGMVWAVKDTLWISSDTGLTWNNSGFALDIASGDPIISIAFHDKLNGLLLTRLGSLYQSSDGGWSWDSIGCFGWSYSVCYDGTANDILLGSGQGFYSSRNGGKTWSTLSIQYAYPIVIQSSVKGHAWAYVYNFDSGWTRTYRSTDFGASWQAHGNACGDNFALDSSDEYKVYAAVRDGIHGDSSGILVSTDGGIHWDTSIVRPMGYFAGSFASGHCAVYAATVGNDLTCTPYIIDTGLYRSVDAGRTWRYIVGPGSPGLSYQWLTLVDDSSIVLSDFRGNLWKNTRLGNGVRNSLSVTPNRLFSDDTLYCASITRSIAILSTGCTPPSIVQLSIVGRDSAAYRVLRVDPDSIVIQLLSRTIGRQSALLIMQVSNGLIDTVVLNGYTYYMPPATAFTPHSLFDGDTVVCDSLLRSVDFVLLGCFPPDLRGVTVVGRDSASYHIGQIVSGTIPVTLLHQGLGSKQASLVFTLTDSSTDTVSLNGFVSYQPDSLAALPRSLFVGDTALCDSLTRFVRVVRYGCSPPSVSAFTITGKDSSSFRLGAMQSDSIPVTLVPDAVGDKHATLIIARSDGQSDTVVLLGSVAPRPTTISILPRVLFATDTARCDSIIRSISIHGAGCAPLAVSSFAITGGDSSAYRLGALHSDSLDVSLISLINGSHRASLIITMSDGSLDSVKLIGYVLREPNALALSAKSLFDGDTARCDTVTRLLTFGRTGCAPPSILSFSIAGKDSASYLLKSSADTISVSLLPVTTGRVPALLITRLSDGSADTIMLNGVCSNEGGNIVIAPRILFAGDTLHCDSVTRSVTIRTSGCVPPILTGWSVIGSDSADFVAHQGGRDTLLVTLLPRREGQQYASLVTQFSDGTNDTVSLSGVNAPARTMAISTNLINLGSLQPCESHDTAIAYTNTSCIPVIFNGWRMMHYGDGFQVYNINYQPLTIPAGETDSLHITFDGSHTGIVYDTVILFLGTDQDSVRRIPVQTYIPPVDSVDFLLSAPSTLTAGNQFTASVLPDRAVSGKGLLSVSSVIAFPTDDFHFDSLAVPSDLTLVRKPPYVTGNSTRVAFAVSSSSGIILDPAKPIVQIWLRAMLADSIHFHISLDSLLLNGGDPNYTNCTLATGGTGTTAILSPACGDPLLQDYLKSNTIWIESITPNPATSSISVLFQNDARQAVSFEVVDVLGAMRQRGTTSEERLTMDVTSLPNGIYYFRATPAFGVSSTRTVLVAR